MILITPAIAFFAPQAKALGTPFSPASADPYPIPRLAPISSAASLQVVRGLSARCLRWYEQLLRNHFVVADETSVRMQLIQR
jgi:hypothetical protein